MFPAYAEPGYQYGVLWEADVHNASIRHLSVARRSVEQTKWEKFTFMDYNQTSDDGHNVYALSFCRAYCMLTSDLLVQDLFGYLSRRWNAAHGI